MVPILFIDRIESLYSRKVHDVPKVPTYEHIGSAYCRMGNMSSIFPIFWGYDFCCKVRVGQLIDFSRCWNNTNVFRAKIIEYRADLFGSIHKFIEQYLRHHCFVNSNMDAFDELKGCLAEFLI